MLGTNDLGPHYLKMEKEEIKDYTQEKKFKN